MAPRVAVWKATAFGQLARDFIAPLDMRAQLLDQIAREILRAICDEPADLLAVVAQYPYPAIAARTAQVLEEAADA